MGNQDENTSIASTPFVTLNQESLLSEQENNRKTNQTSTEK